MTSKNSSSKVGAISLIIAAFRRHLWLVTIALITFLFGLPIFSALDLQGGFDGLTPAERLEVMQFMADNLLNNMFQINALITIVGAFLAALAVFRYLQRKKQVDFYHSLPISRGRLFAVNYATGFLIYLIPFLISLILTAIVIVGMGYGSLFAWGSFLGCALNAIIFFLALYSTIVLAVMLSGTMLTALLFSAVFFSIGPAVIGFCLAILETFRDTYWSAFGDFSTWMINTSPIAKYVETVNLGGSLSTMIGVLIFAVVMTVLAYICNLKRPSEVAGSALAFRRSKPIFKYVISIICSLYFGLFFYMMGAYSPMWLFFGTIVGAIIFNQLLEIWFAADFNRITRGWISVAVTAVLMCAFYGCVLADVTGYDEYLPTADEVVQVNVITSIDDFESAFYSSSSDFYSQFGGDMADRAQYYNLTDPAAIQAAINIASYGVQSLQEDDESEIIPGAAESAVADIAYDSYATVEQVPAVTYFGVLYTLESGKTVARYYYGLESEQVTDDLLTIVDSEEYRSGYYRSQRYPAAQQYVVQVDDFNFESLTAKELTDEESRAIVETFVAEQHELGAAERCSELPVGTITLSIFIDPERQPSSLAEAYKLTEEFTGEDIPYAAVAYPIYPSYTQTIALVNAAYGRDMFADTAEGIQYINVYNDVSRDYVSNYYDGYDDTITYEAYLVESYGFSAEELDTLVIRDRAEIERIVAETALMEAFNYNWFITPDSTDVYSCIYDGYSIERCRPIYPK